MKSHILNREKPYHFDTFGIPYYTTSNESSNSRNNGRKKEKLKLT